jgi:hypothetical protein
MSMMPDKICVRHRELSNQNCDGCKQHATDEENTGPSDCFHLLVFVGVGVGDLFWTSVFGWKVTEFSVLSHPPNTLTVQTAFN